jgi:ADP-heptose:LPS heptosyltransferase
MPFCALTAPRATSAVIVPRDVFVFRFGQLGDTLVALPAIHRIAQLHPHDRLWLITDQPARSSMVTAWDVLQHTGLFRGAVFYSRDDWRQIARLALRVRRSENPLLYYLSPVRSAARQRRDRVFFRWLCGVRAIEAMTPARELTPREPDGRLRVLPRETARLLASVDPAARPPSPPFLAPPSAAAHKTTALLQPLAGRPLIALGPGSKMPSKRWFLERYLELCRRIVARHPNVGLVVLGGPEDRAEGERVLAAVGPERALNLAGETDIIESAAALAHCRLYIGNDTGTMHLAATMGVPCVAIFTSRENREVWYPWGDANAVLRRDLPCSGCMLERCEVERMRCLDLISVDDVWAEVAPRLDALR